MPDQKPQELPPCAMYRFTDPLPFSYCVIFHTVTPGLAYPHSQQCRAKQLDRYVNMLPPGSQLLC